MFGWGLSDCLQRREWDVDSGRVRSSSVRSVACVRVACSSDQVLSACQSMSSMHRNGLHAGSARAMMSLTVHEPLGITCSKMSAPLSQLWC